MISQRLRILCLSSRADLSSIFVLVSLPLSFWFRGCALGTWLDGGSCESRSGRLVVREDAFVTFIADSRFMERANTVVMVFAGFAFVAFPF